jgi:hypothetical protein
MDLSSAWSPFGKWTSTIVPESDVHGTCPGKCIEPGIMEVGGWCIKGMVDIFGMMF